MKRKFLSLGLAAVMLLLSLAACSSGNEPKDNTNQDNTNPSKENSEVASTESGEVEKIVFSFPATKIIDGIEMVEADVNKITKEKIGVEVHFEPISMAKYSEQVNLMMSSGEQLDAISYLGTFSQLLSRNQLMAMDDYIDVYGKEAKEALGENFLKSATSKGSLYGLPTLNGKAAVLNIVLRKDKLEENNISTDGLKQASNFKEYTENLDILSDIFAKLKEAEPDMVMLVPGSSASMYFTTVPFVDDLGDNYGVLVEGENKVSNVYESEEFKTLLSYSRDWYNKGYILQDAATTTESNNTYLQSGRTTGYFIPGEEGQAEQITTATGVEVEAIKLLNPYINTNGVNGMGFGIASTSKHPEAAMKWLNEMYSNPDVVNLLDWGIEGVHYEKQEDGTIDFPEGVDANNTTYGLNMDWFFGNQFLGYIWGKGRDTTIYERLDQNNKTATFSSALGFSYDSTKVRNELTALKNVYDEYMPGLMTGTIDPDTELPKYLEALDKAGLPVVIEEKQKQYDEWTKNQ